MSKVSVIMPVYNGEKFIAKAIDSVLVQNFQDWELIIINDGSTDNTAEILAEYNDARICVLHQHNQGEAVARNCGLDAANGQYIAFLDADDLYLPHALHDMCAYLDTHSEADALFSNGYYCDKNDKILGQLSQVRPGPFTGNILEPLLLNPDVITVPICTMTRYKTIKDADVRFDPALIIGPDWDFWIHLSRFAQFGYLDKLTCLYRIHNTNITKTSGWQRRTADLVRGRLKVLHSAWFPELSLSTRRQFFYNLLIGLLTDDPQQQNTIMHMVAFISLPAEIQADLLRLVASDHLRQAQHSEFAIQCLQESLALKPHNRKSRLLLRLASKNLFLTKAALSIWQVVHKGQLRLASVGQKRPQSVPATLLPTAN